jgi:hypothetical protein
VSLGCDYAVGHEADESGSVCSGWHCRDSASLDPLLKGIFKFFDDAKVLNVVNDSNVIDEFAILTQELVATAVYELLSCSEAHLKHEALDTRQLLTILKV